MYNFIVNKKNLKIAIFKDLISIPVIESNEEMLNITDIADDCVCKYEQFEMTKYTGDSIFARKSLVFKLKNISEKLVAKFPDYKLKVEYGYRHPEVQKNKFERRKKAVLLENPNLQGFDLDELTNTMVAHPETAGHPTGGAVDITITTPSGDLDMGTKIADFSDPQKIITFCDYITDEQKENRKLLLELMTSEGFAPFYGEWWHFCYGDKEWAFFYDKPNAIYSQIDFKI